MITNLLNNEKKHSGKPDTTNKVEWGEYVALNMVECFSCHSKDFATNDYTNPSKSKGYLGGGNKFDIPGSGIIISRNLTMDEETGLGSWSEETFIQAVKYGKSPNWPLRPPMRPYNGPYRWRSKSNLSLS